MLKIIISPAKKMNLSDEYFCVPTQPVFFEDTILLHHLLTTMQQEELKNLWQCSEKLTAQNYERLHTFSPQDAATPALLAYEGIQYQYMAPHIFTEAQWDYVSEHLSILSGFYGILRPTDKVIPYRLEMQAKLKTSGADNLYDYWGNRLYKQLIQTAVPKNPEIKKGSDTGTHILNLASAEYSKTVLPYIESTGACTTCIFGELINQKVKVKGTQAKMARGEMVRWMSEHQIQTIEQIREFNCLGYCFDEKRTTDHEYVFLKTDQETVPEF